MHSLWPNHVPNLGDLVSTYEFSENTNNLWHAGGKKQKVQGCSSKAMKSWNKRESLKCCPRKADANNIENHDADESTKVVKRKTLNAIPLQQFEVRKIRNKSGREATVGNVGWKPWQSGIPETKLKMEFKRREWSSMSNAAERSTKKRWTDGYSNNVKLVSDCQEQQTRAYSEFRTEREERNLENWL